MRLSEPQKRVVRHAASDLTSMFAGGAIRSGKSYSSALGLAVHMARFPAGHDFALVGHSVEVCMRNVGFDILDMLRGLGGSPYVDKRFGTRIVCNGQNLWVVGCNDARSANRIQGATLAGLLVDEITLVPHSFWQMCWGRLSVSGAKLWATFNPEHPRHWLKREVLDRVGAYDGVVLDFQLDHNPTLSDRVKQRYRASYQGHWHARLVEGRWAGASGLIFPRWTDCDAVPFEHGTWRASMDWGVSSVLHALVASVGRDGAVKVVGELRHDARSDGVWTEQEAVNAVGGFLGAHAVPMPVYVDPSTPESAKRLLRQQGFRVANANNDVLGGLSRTAEALSSGDVRICADKCPSLVDELGSYSWDAAKTDLGEDAPVKADDHGADALRYLIHSVGYSRNARPTSVADLLRGK